MSTWRCQGWQVSVIHIQRGHIACQLSLCLKVWQVFCCGIALPSKCIPVCKILVLQDRSDSADSKFVILELCRKIVNIPWGVMFACLLTYSLRPSAWVALKILSIRLIALCWNPYTLWRGNLCFTSVLPYCWMVATPRLWDESWLRHVGYISIQQFGLIGTQFEVPLLIANNMVKCYSSHCEHNFLTWVCTC